MQPQYRLLPTNRSVFVVLCSLLVLLTALLILTLFSADNTLNRLVHGPHLSTLNPGSVTTTFYEIPPLTLDEAQRQVAFSIPTFGWLPPGFKLGGAHVTPPDWANIYYVPITSSTQTQHAGFGVSIRRGHDQTKQMIQGTEPQEALFIQGQPASFMAAESSGMVRWEANGLSYTLTYSGIPLRREDVQRLADSLR